VISEKYGTIINVKKKKILAIEYQHGKKGKAMLCEASS